MASWICLSFFLSGFAALLYEVLWVRLFTLVCGHTALAAAAVLTAFMAGLALGSLLGGKAADQTKPKRLLALYAALELLIALGGLLSRPAISLAQALLATPRLLDLPFAPQGLAVFAAAFVVLIAPTTLMGATLPVLTRHLSVQKNSGKTPDRALSLLYGMNTLGAVCGTAAAGFWLIPAWGMKRSLALAAGLNLLAAAAAFSLYRIRDAAFAPKPDKASGKGRPRWSWGALVLFMTGAAAMLCEVAWTRAFVLVLGSSTYAFTVMLTTFLLGLAAGSLAFHRLEPKLRPGPKNWAMPLMGAALSLGAALVAFSRAPYAFMRLYPWTTQGSGLLHAVQFALCGAVILLPAVFMGLSLPWGLAVLKGSRVGRDAGLCYAANTMGAIAGSAAAGLCLLPWLGAARTLGLAVWIYATCAVFCLLSLKPRRAAAAFALALGLGVLAAPWLPAWSPRMMSSGMFLYAPYYQDMKSYTDFVKHLNRDKVLFYRDGMSATAAILESPWGDRYLRVNGKTDASLGSDMPTQLLLGYLPLLVHPGSPQSALVVGFGSGMTAAALASDKDLKTLDAVEIEPAVVEASRWFDQANRQVLKDPRLKLIFADARQVLAASAARYDLITSEPSNPWMAGVANLFTREAFELAKERLSEDGVFCQWFHSYFMAEDDFRMVLATFASVFPHVMLMSTGDADFFLMGSKAPWRIDYAKIQRAFQENALFKEDLALAEAGLEHPLTFLASSFVLDDADFRRFAQGAPLHLDDRPTLEFSAPRYLHHAGAKAILKSVLAFKTAVLPDGLEGFKSSPASWSLLYCLTGEAFLRSSDFETARYAFEKALRYDRNSARAWTDLGRVQEALGQESEARRDYRRAVALEARYAPAKTFLGALYAKQGLETKGLRLLEEALRLSPGDARASLELARIKLKKGSPEEAFHLARGALARPVPDPDLRRELGLTLELAQGR